MITWSAMKRTEFSFLRKRYSSHFIKRTFSLIGVSHVRFKTFILKPFSKNEHIHTHTWIHVARCRLCTACMALRRKGYCTKFTVTRDANCLQEKINVPYSTIIKNKKSVFTCTQHNYKGKKTE